MGYIVFLFLLVIGVAAWLVQANLRPRLFVRWARRSKLEFGKNRRELESKFFRAASLSGKPRGLTWSQCAFQDDVVLARDRGNGELVGLVGVTIGFEAIEGGGMEDVEAVGNLRAATAVFTHNGREWTTQGRAVFNLEPHEVLARYRESLVAVAV